MMISKAKHCGLKSRQDEFVAIGMTENFSACYSESVWTLKLILQ